MATDEWVVFSSARRGRPVQLRQYPKSVRVSQLESHDSECPFCKGNEHMSPEPTLCMKAPDGSWLLRVVPNLYPAVTPPPAVLESSVQPVDDEADRSGNYFNLASVPAVGFHEVVVEGPEHNVPSALAPLTSVKALVHALQSRGRAMLTMGSTLRHIMYFKNSGLKAGASLLHPHSQILGLPILPNEVARRQRHARTWYRNFRRNVFDDTIDETLKERDRALLASGVDGAKHRVVLEDDLFVCFVPYAALSPFSLWIVPKRAGEAHFHEASDETLDAFAQCLHAALRKLHFGLDEPDFNLVIRSAALETGAMSIYRSELFFRWYCLIVPRLGVGAMGGFEFSTGIQSNSSMPEDDAAFLRSVDVEPCL